MLNYRRQAIDFKKFQNVDLSNASFWGASAKGAIFDGSVMKGADCRLGDFSKAKLIGVNCRQVNFLGAYLYQTDFRGADLSLTKISSPSILTSFFSPETCLDDAIYLHLGEEEYWLRDVLETQNDKIQIFLDPKNHVLKRA